MLSKHGDKAVTSASNKRDRDRGAEMYPASEGWEPRYNQSTGGRTGFYRPADGFKFDPDSIIERPIDPVEVAVNSDPAVIAARAEFDTAVAAFDAETARWQAAVAGQAERELKRRRDLEAALPPGASAPGANPRHDYVVLDAVAAREEAHEVVVLKRVAMWQAEAAARARCGNG